MPSLKEVALFAIFASAAISTIGLLYLSSLNLDIMTAGENTDVTVESIRITKSQDGDTAMAQVEFKIHNPSSISLRINSIEYRLFTNNLHVWTAYEFPDFNEVGGKTTITIHSQAEFPQGRVPSVETGEWQVTGTVWFASDLTGEFNKKFRDSIANIERG